MTDGGRESEDQEGRQVLGRREKRLVWKYQEKENDDERVKVDMYVDSDGASGWSRKSTSEGMSRW